MIIYPPIIGDTIPAFIKDVIKIPFIHNAAVDFDEVKGFNLIIKELANSKQIGTINSEEFTNNLVVFKNDIELIEG
jgi:hypothetical protein